MTQKKEELLLGFLAQVLPRVRPRVANFINNKELLWVFGEHKKRNLPEKNFSESYRRYGKSVVKVGHGKVNDRALGLLFEWVLETNPYTTANGDIKAQLR